MEKDISDEEYERIKKHIDELLFVDLILWRNQMINRGKVNNRLFYLLDDAVKKREKEIYSRRRK